MQSEEKAITILRLPAVKARTGLATSSIYQLIAEDNFPKSRKITSRRVGWIEAEVDAWIRSRVAATIDPPKGKGRKAA
jgi:prophage regulatory protein